MSGNAARLSANSLLDQIARMTNCTEIRTLRCDDGLLHVNAGTDELETATVTLSELDANDDGYVLMAIESYDPPTEPLDENDATEITNLSSPLLISFRLALKVTIVSGDWTIDRGY